MRICMLIWLVWTIVFNLWYKHGVGKNWFKNLEYSLWITLIGDNALVWWSGQYVGLLWSLNLAEFRTWTIPLNAQYTYAILMFASYCWGTKTFVYKLYCIILSSIAGQVRWSNMDTWPNVRTNVYHTQNTFSYQTHTFVNFLVVWCFMRWHNVSYMWWCINEYEFKGHDDIIKWKHFRVTGQ